MEIATIASVLKSIPVGLWNILKTPFIKSQYEEFHLSEKSIVIRKKGGDGKTFYCPNCFSKKEEFIVILQHPGYDYYCTKCGNSFYGKDNPNATPRVEVGGSRREVIDNYFDY